MSIVITRAFDRILRNSVRSIAVVKYYNVTFNAQPLEKRSNVHFTPVRNLSIEAITDVYFRIYNKVAESEACEFTRNTLIGIHDSTGLPWWATIIVASGLLKNLYSFPIRIYQEHLLAWSKITNAEWMEAIPKIKKNIELEQRKNLWTPAKAKFLFKVRCSMEKKKIIEKYNSHPLKVFLLSYFNIPPWILLSISLRTMSLANSNDLIASQILHHHFSTEGLFWCSNLCLPDTTYIIPLTILITQLAIVELNNLNQRELSTRKSLRNVLLNMSRFFVVLQAVISAYVPSSVAIFWLSSAGFTLLHHILFYSPSFRQLIKIPHVQNAPVLTYDDIIKGLKRKWWWMGKRCN